MTSDSGFVHNARGGVLPGENQGKIGNDHAFRRHRLRLAVHRLRDLGHPVGPRGRPGQCTYAGDCGRDPGGRAGLSHSPVHHHRACGRRGFPHHMVAPGRHRSDRLPDRRRAFGRCRLHRNARLGPRQCAHRAGCVEQPVGRPRHRLQGRRDHRNAGGRPRPSGGLGLLLGPDRTDGGCPLGPRRHRRARRARLRRFADLDLRASGRRHLHQGCGCRRRSGRQGGSGHSRGRSAQSGDDRGQCRRQCRRLRGHGGRSVRDLRRDRGCDDGARGDLLPRLRSSRLDHDLSAGDLRRLHHHLDHRHLFRQA
jgi:hypothetical protein